MNITGTRSSALIARSVPRLGVRPPRASALQSSKRSAPPAAAARASSREETITSRSIGRGDGNGSPIERSVRGAGAVVGGLRLQRSEAGPGARAENALLRYVVHVDRNAQDGGQRDEVAADVTVADRAVVGAPVVHHGVN